MVVVIEQTAGSLWVNVVKAILLDRLSIDVNFIKMASLIFDSDWKPFLKLL